MTNWIAFNSPWTTQTRILLLSLLITNMVLYGVLIPTTLFADPWDAVITVSIILLYYIIEVSCFFGNVYNWSVTLTFRIIWLVHDLSYLIVYAVCAARSRKYYGINIACAVFFSLTFVVGIAIICTYSRFNRVFPRQFPNNQPSSQREVPRQAANRTVTDQTLQNQTHQHCCNNHNCCHNQNLQHYNSYNQYNHQNPGQYPVQYVNQTPSQPVVVVQQQEPASRRSPSPILPLFGLLWLSRRDS